MPEKVVIGNAELWLGDCREVLPMIGGVDAVVMDPPYGYNYASNRTCDTTTAEWMNQAIEGDEDTASRDFVIKWADAIPWACFGSWKMPKPFGTRAVLVWDKGPASGMGDLSFPWKGSWEEIYIGGYGWKGRRDEGVLKNHWIVTRASMGRLHPNEKPVSLILGLINKLSIGCTILDPFMGSGTCGVAAIQSGHPFKGVEINPGYFEIACKRIEHATEQAKQRLFGPEPEPQPETPCLGLDDAV